MTDEKLRAQGELVALTAGWIDRFIPLIDEDGLDEEEHCCEWTLCQDRKRIRSELSKLYAAPVAQPVDVTDTPQEWFNLLAEARQEAYDEEGYTISPDLADAVEKIYAVLAAAPAAPVQVAQPEQAAECRHRGIKE
jgi:hypothetical protein